MCAGWRSVEVLDDRFGARLHMQFLVDMAQMGPDGWNRDTQLFGELLVGIALSEAGFPPPSW